MGTAYLVTVNLSLTFFPVFTIKSYRSWLYLSAPFFEIYVLYIINIVIAHFKPI